MAKKSKKCNRTNIGGQAVFEGVMMRGATSMATAVRDEEGAIRLETKRLKAPEKKNFFVKLPIVRGVVNFFNSMVGGITTLMRSAEVYGGDEPTKFDKWLSEKLKIDVMQVIIFIGVALGLALSVLLFILSPQWASELISRLTGISQTSFAFNLIEGCLRMVIFVIYILLTSLMKDIKRTYMYHGAEHKTISCYEEGKELTVENVRSCTRVHDRCGTTFMFFVMLVSILVFSLTNSFLGVTGFLRALVKIAFLPLVAGLSYELLKGLAKTDWWIFYPIKLPGLLLQRITTSEPTDDMIEVSIKAFTTVLEMEADQNISTQDFITARKICDLHKDVEKILTDGGVTDTADGEWIVSICAKVNRSEISGNLKYVKPSVTEKALKIAKERATGKPLWYIVGDTEFYGRKFVVDERVLIPRPETEELVYNALNCITDQSKVLDMCTGSGAIAITINLEKSASVTAVDVSGEALKVAKQNALALGAKVDFIESNMFEGLGEEKFHLIISNPPYVSATDMGNLQREVTFEPKIALSGGEDGLDFYREICKNAPNFLFEKGVLLMECGYNQAREIEKMLQNAKSVEIIKDLQGVERMVKAVF